MKGNYFTFVKVDKENVEHKEALKNISDNTSYLGDLSSYRFSSTSNKITGCNYIIYENQSNTIIGYLGLSDEVSTVLGNSVTIYYAILKQFYGKGYGKLILNEVSDLLKKYSSVDVIIANVERSNIFGIRTIERANYQEIPELSDEEEIQYHKYL